MISTFRAILLCALLSLVIRCYGDDGIDARQHLTSLNVERERNTLNVRQLLRGRPLVGIVEKGESRLVHFGVLPYQGRFPDLSLYLEAVDSGSQVKLYCSPRHHLRATVVPNPRTSKWHSTAEGQVFMSSISLPYQESIVETQLPRSGIDTKVARFTCAIHGVKSAVSKFQLTLRLSFNQRTLIPSHKEAMRHIYKECCPTEEDCTFWKTKETRESNSTDEVELDFCHRVGSICNINGELKRLSLKNYGLKCKLPVEALLNVSTLESIDLAQNKLQADVESDIIPLGSLKKLTDLTVASNLISGDLSVPDLCSKLLPNLQTLDMEDNFITGRLPACLFSSSRKLEELYLSGNKLTGHIPDVFSTSSSLKALSLSRNQLVGEMPVTLGRIVNLEVLYLSDNNLNGPLPSSLSQLFKLEALDLSGNRFSKLPNSWSSTWNPSSTFFVLKLQNNKFRGSLPNRLLEARSLETLDMSNNAFTGKLYSKAGMFPNLRYFNLSQNQLTGRISNNFKSLGAFGPYKSTGHRHYFDLSFNKLTGDLPEYLYQENSPYIGETEIYLEGNNLTCHRWFQLNYIPNFECQSSKSKKLDTTQDSEFLESERDLRYQLKSGGNDNSFGSEGSSDQNKRANILVGLVGAFVGLIVLAGVIALIIKYKHRRARMLGLEYGIPDDASTSEDDEETEQQAMNGDPENPDQAL